MPINVYRTIPWKFRPQMSHADALCFIAQRVEPTMNTIYKTRCPNCGAELVFDGLFFDREPLEILSSYNSMSVLAKMEKT